MYKIISLTILTLLLCLIGLCTAIASDSSKPAAAPISVYVGAPSLTLSVSNSCPIVSGSPVNVSQTITSALPFQTAQTPASQAGNQGIPVPVMSDPAFGATVFSLTPEMQWQGYANDASYTLQIAIDQNFTNLVVNLKGIKDTSYDIPSGTFSWNGAYYWRVNASDIDGATSSWSAMGYFSVIQELGFHT